MSESSKSDTLNRLRVYNSLLGSAFAYKNLVVLENYNIILRKDHRTITGKVKILSGGPAGSEPGEIGCIGQGMLTGAVFGELFVAPPASSILVAIRELAYEHTDGILLLVKNSTGNQLNFGLAMEKAISENITIRMLLIGDDAGDPCPGKCGRRGLAGSILIYKIAGAMAESGKSLDDIFTACRERFITDLSTINVCLEPTSFLKWKNLESEKNENVAEIGLGLSGQSGVKMKYTTLHDLICKMIDILSVSLNFNVSTTTNRMPIILLLNNLGGISKLDESVIFMETVNELVNRNFAVIRNYAGTFMSILDSKGFSITLLKITDFETLSFLDAETMSFLWPKDCAVNCEDIFAESGEISYDGSINTFITVKPILNHEELDGKFYPEDMSFGPLFSESHKAILKQIISFAAEALISCEKQINIIDGEVGDGDAGTMLKNGAIAIKQAIEENLIDLMYPYKMLRDLSELMMRNIGGITGALYSTFFFAAAKTFLNTSDINLNTWFEAFQSGVRAIRFYGGAQIGERTLLDALDPAVGAFKQAIENNDSIHRTVSNVACTCEYYAEETKKIKPLYVRGNQPRDNLLYPDAGAHAAAVWIRAVSEAFDPDLETTRPGLFLWKFLTEDEAANIHLNASKKDIMQFLDNKLGKDNVLQLLLFETASYCRINFESDAKKTSSAMGIMYFSHLYFTASRWRMPEETYNFFKESVLHHSLEHPPTSLEIFSPNEAKELLLFFIEIYMRNLPLVRLLCLPHYKLRLAIDKSMESCCRTKQ